LVIRDGEAQRIEDVKALVLEVAAPELSPGADAANVEVSSLTGGITNQLFRAKFPSGRSVVVRVYGLGTERIISRAAEVYWQSQFLRTFGRCRNGLVYEFLDGMHPVADAAECAQVAPRIAAALARFHHDATRNSLMTPPYATEALYLDVVCSDWLATAREALVKLSDNPTAAAVVQQWTQRCAQVCEVVGALKPHLPVAVCHNDLLLGNVMVDSAGTVRVIDFEYARRNYALYDVANHFNEWPGFDCDWTQLPTPEQRRAFLGAYFAEMQACGVQVDASAAAVEAADVLVDVLMLASHAAWGVWAVYQQAHSAIAFDYLPYSNRRLARYDSTVDAVLARAKATFPECFP
jgi:ethanolamine kinase